MAKHYDKQFKLDSVQYYHDHKNLGPQIPVCRGEDKIICAKRELLEETGITATSLEKIGRYDCFCSLVCTSAEIAKFVNGRRSTFISTIDEGG